MAEALYRKYRPNTFEDVVGQEHIERTLKNAIEQNKVSHAYLFCGPRGTGKTTLARILSKSLLCEKAPTIDPDGTCEDCEMIAAGNHPDVYELDAASRTGVENVREEIINRVHYAPTRGSHKIYIIDEAHMLSPAAFNALLKTLEEPPEHVIFILCTTDPQKILDTIHSRCQRFDFHRLSADEIVARLGAVCVQEGIEFEPEALELIAHQAGGGMRNALTSLEQLAAFGEGKVTLDGAHNILGTLDDEGLSEIINALGKHDATACFTWVSRYVETGADIAQFVQDLAEHLRNLYLLSLTDADVEIPVSSSARTSMEAELEMFGPERLSRALGVLGDLMKELRSSTNSRLTFEIALTRLLRPESDLTMAALSERLEEVELKLLSMPSAAVAMSASAVAPAGAIPVATEASAAIPAVQAQPTVQPVQPSATPSPQVAPQTTPAPAPSPAPQAIPAPAPTPATQATQASASVPVATAFSQASVPSAPAQGVAGSVDFSNTAALQRMWHQVTTALQKSNPARGVLFMSTKIEPNPQTGGVKIVFPADSNFAFNAAQKPEVRELLTQGFIDVCGTATPFEFSLAQGQSSAPTSAGVPTPAASPATTGSIPPVSAVAPAAPAAAVPPPVSATSPTPDAVETPIPIPTPAPAPIPSPSPVPASTPSQAVYEDESPFFEDTFSAEPSAPAAPAPSPESDAASSAPANEAEQLKAQLTDMFGEGVKFDTM